MKSMREPFRRARRALRGTLLAVVAASALAACGGGTQVQAFKPGRVIALGDETSVLDDFKGDANARKYSVNALLSANDPSVLSCKVFPIWIQVLATFYGITFPQCNAPDPVANPTGRIRATFNAHVADIAGQIDAQAAESAFTSTDFVTVLVGQHDILDAYAQYPTVGEAQLVADLEAAGTALGVQVNRIADTGAKVLLSTVLDQGITPFAQAEKAAHADVDRAALLQRLTARFNAALRQTIINDGRKIGLILADEYFDSVYTIVNAGGFTNVTTPVCDLTKSQLVPASILDCSTLTLITGGSATSYVWADTIHLSAGAQAQLGALAVQRAQNNPF